MAGPSFIHVRNVDNIVVNVFSASVAPPVGVTEFNETHPVFSPMWTETQWLRTAPTAYTDTNVPADINDSLNATNIVAVTAADIAADHLNTKITTTSGKITSTVANPAANETLDLDVNEAAVDHDLLLNFVANEHIDHSTVTLTAPADSGMTVDGTNLAQDLTASRTLSVDITGTTQEAGIVSADELLFYDVSAAALRKVTVTDLFSAVGATDTMAQQGGCIDVDRNEQVSARWGGDRAIAGPTMPLAYQIVRISATSDAALTAGQIDIRASINGVQLVGVGQTATIASPNINAFANYPAPVAGVAGDIINMVCTGDGALTPQNRDVTCTVWYTFA